jgi:hypothetical protein
MIAKVTTRVRWDASAVGASLEAALAEIAALIEQCSPDLADALLDEFQTAFEAAFRRKDAGAAAQINRKYLARFRALAEEGEVMLRSCYISPDELTNGNATGLQPHEISAAAQLMETGLKTVLDFAIEAAKSAPAVEEDRWLAPTQVTEKYGLARRWIFEHRGEPFVKDLGRKTLLISEQKLVRWLNGNRVRVAR